MWHIKNFIQKFSGIFRNIQQYSAMFVQRGIKAYWDIQALLKHIEPYSDILRTLRNPWIHNHALFRTLAHLESEASSKACQTCKMMRNIQSPVIVRIVFSSFFNDIQGSSEMLMPIQPHSQAYKLGEGESFPLPFF